VSRQRRGRRHPRACASARQRIRQGRAGSCRQRIRYRRRDKWRGRIRGRQGICARRCSDRGTWRRGGIRHGRLRRWRFVMRHRSLSMRRRAGATTKMARHHDRRDQPDHQDKRNRSSSPPTFTNALRALAGARLGGRRRRPRPASTSGGFASISRFHVIPNSAYPRMFLRIVEVQNPPAGRG